MDRLAAAAAAMEQQGLCHGDFKLENAIALPYGCEEYDAIRVRLADNDDTRSMDGAGQSSGPQPAADTPRRPATRAYKTLVEARKQQGPESPLQVGPVCMHEGGSTPLPCNMWPVAALAHEFAAATQRACPLALKANGCSLRVRDGVRP